MSERQEQNRELLEALEALNSRRTLAVVQRTRCQVMETARRMQEVRAQSRQRLGIALLVLGVFLLLSTPALWGLSEAAFSENTITDISLLTLTAFLVLLPTAMGVLLGRGRKGRTSL
ncbi:MAG: hypothetical protein M1568_02380 [Acidobacteria bacterium]|jgi:hypothetical protein|nr:hypothetical protein [Acidobacteriota bacterium]